MLDRSNRGKDLKSRELDVLRHMAEGLTNREIAQRLHIGVETVRTYAKQIYAKLDVSGRVEASRKAMILGLLDDAPTEESPVSQTQFKLPAQLTSFIGRQQELDSLDRLLEQSNVRLVTILAPGGMGKTRLAIEAAARQWGKYPDGTFFVALEPLVDAGNMVTVIADVLDYTFQSGDREPRQQLLDYLSHKQMLLVLDNFEHLLAGASLVEDILRAATGITILVTSREKLNLSGEHVFQLGGMHFPDWETPDDALEYDAVQLLVASAQRLKSDWEVTEDNLDFVARICRLTAGMPLGILLATSWLDLLPLEKIAAEIQKNVDFLATDMRDVPDRQRSMRAVFDYTWQQLAPDERDLFMHLSVFRGGFTYDAVQAIVSADLRTLHRLMSKALITRTADERYDIHALLRQFGAEYFDQSDGPDAVRDAHSRFFLDVLASLKITSSLEIQQKAFRQIDHDFENIRAGWEWAAHQQYYDLLHAAAESLHLYCRTRGLFYEAETMMMPVIQALEGKPDYERTWAHLMLINQLSLISMPAEQPITSDELDHCLSIMQQHDDQCDIGLCLLVSGLVEWTAEPNFERALDYFQQALERFEAVNNPYYKMVAVGLIGYSTGSLGNYRQACEYFQQSIVMHREMNNMFLLGFHFNNLGATNLVLDAYGDSIQILMRAISLSQDLKHGHDLSWSYAFLGLVYFLGGEYDNAQYYATEGEKLGNEVGYTNTLSVALTVLSLLASMNLDYDHAESLAQRAVPFAKKSNPFIVPFAYCSLAIAISGLDRTEEALAVLRPIVYLPRMREAILHWGMITAVMVAHLYRIEQYEQTTRYLSFLLNVGYRTSAWAKGWQLLSQIQDDLQTQLDEATFNTCWEEGRLMSLDEITKAIRNFVGSSTS